MRVLTAAEARGLDELTIRLGLASGEELMERAGRGVAEALAAHLGDPLAWRVLVLCGGGNNGGDGFVTARHLRAMGATVRVGLLVPKDKVQGDARAHLAAMEAAGGRADDASTDTALATLTTAGPWDVAIDAMLGTGANLPLRGMVAAGAESLALLRTRGTRVVAVDLPTGVSADLGSETEGAVRADLTVTFGHLKRGHVLHPGRERCGDVQVMDLGFADADALGALWSDADAVAPWLPVRHPRAHKGESGRVLIVGGAAGMTGAAVLAARAAYRAGAGYVRACVPASVADSLLAAAPELMAVACGETVHRSLTTSAEREVLAEAVRSQAVALGPGLSRDPRSAALARALIASITVPLVIDADALHAVSPAADGLRERIAARRAPTVLTPHVGEMAALTGIGATEIESRRIDVAIECAKAWGATVVLKGGPTVIASADGRVSVNSTGGPALATAGTGDVLAGAIAALLAQGLAEHEAAAAAVHVHGRAGDLAAMELGGPGIVASDVGERLPRVMQELRERAIRRVL